MPLEATVIIIDNSEYMRNGDFQPTRFQAQSDAVNTVFGHKVDSNPENTVGLMSMAGKGAEVLVTHTREQGKLLQALHSARQKLGGAADIATAIAVAQLALKHRANKNLRQRIIVFVGSPLAADEKALVRLAKKLKKNNVAVDVVSFGEDAENSDRLKAFVEHVSSSDNSHLVAVQPGPRLISDAVISSPILAGDELIPGGMDGIEGTGGASHGGDFEFGVDPTMDPELAMALRMSLEEERARQLAESTAASSATPPAAVASASTPAPVAAPAPPAPDAAMSEMQPADPTDDEEEALLQQALAMSTGAEGEDLDMGDEEMSEEEEIARAIEMSMKPEGK